MQDVEFNMYFTFELTELLEEHGDMLEDLKSKVTESFYESDPVFEDVERELLNEFDEAKVNDMMEMYSSSEASWIVANFVSIYLEGVYIDPEESDLKEGSLCIAVPCTFCVDSFAEDYAEKFE